MKHDWEYKKLGDVCLLTMGQSPSSDSYNNEGEGLPFFQGCSDFGKIHPTITTFCTAPTKIAQTNDVLMSVRAPIGTLNIADVECCIGRGLASFKPFKDGVGEFLYYVLKHSKDKLQALGTGSTFKAIGKDALKKFIIPYPPLPIQQQIVAELDTLNEILDKKRQQLKELDTLAQAIFYDMFGDPVENEKGWEVKKLGEVCDSVSYGTSSPACENGKYKYLRMNNLTYSGYIDLSNVKTINLPDESYEKYVVRKDDILFNRTNSRELVGKTALFNLDEEMIIAGYIIRVRVRQREVLPNFIVKYMNTPFIKDYLYNLCKGAVNQANINSKELQNIPLYVPPLSLQQSFAEKIEAIEKQKELIKVSMAEVETLLAERMEYWFGE